MDRNGPGGFGRRGRGGNSNNGSTARGRGSWRGRFGGRSWYRKRGSGTSRGSGNSHVHANDTVEGDIDQNSEGLSSPPMRGNFRGGGSRAQPRGSSRGSSRSENHRPNRKPSVAEGGSGSSSDSDRGGTEQEALSKLIRNQWVKKFPGYPFYFPNKHSIFPDLADKLKLLMELYRRVLPKTDDIFKKIEEKEMHDFSFEDFTNDTSFREGWKDFEDDLENSPQDVLNSCGLALHQVVYENTNNITEERTRKSKAHLDIGDSGDEDDEVDPGVEKAKIDVPYIRVGILRTNPVIALKALKASLLGKFVTIRGAVVRTGNVKIMCIRVNFECPDCGGTFTVDLPEGRWVKPKTCKASVDCNNKKDFEPILDATSNRYIEHTKIRIQDVQHSHLEHGRIPRTIDCILHHDLVHHSNAGEILTVCGIVKMSDEEAGHQSGDQSLHNLYLDAVAVKNHKDSDRTMGGHWFSFSNKDYYAVKEIYEKEDLFRLLVHSLCPSIFGHDMVKAGILLALLGGTMQSTGGFDKRADINVLVVGDPGLGKSQILKVVSEVAPRGVYVCGTGTTNAGLTVTLVKEGDDFSLEAGALVMGDKGVCCIDEFDKMQSQHNALLEAMEQQSVSIAKAGVFRTLPARTSVIAAANPVGGHYDNTKTVSENIRISGPLLSRFDLIFLLQDKSDQKHDRGIINHVLGITTSVSQVSRDRENSHGSSCDAEGTDLSHYLKIRQGEIMDLIPHSLLRKFIAYAKQYVHPRLEPEAAQVIKEFYLNLRKNHRHVDSTPVTTRQLESLKRLAEARAKAELRETATATDARQAVEIFEFCMSGVYENDKEVTLGFTQDILNASRASANLTPAASRSVSRNVAKKLLAKIEFASNQTGQTVFSTEEIQQLGESIGIESGFNRLIDCLNNDGFLLKKGSDKYKFQCA